MVSSAALRNASRAGGTGPPTTVASYVTEAIRSGILDGRYELGSRLDQQTLADELGASIIPVRESLRQLEAEGLVQILPRRGAFVTEPTVAEVRELFRLREVLEPFATKEAVPSLTPPDIDQLEALAGELIRAGRNDAYATWTRLNRTWHFILYGATQSPLLLQIIGGLWDRCTLTSHAYARDPGHRIASTEDHASILQAVRAGDADLAAQIVGEHVHNAMVDLLLGRET
jgi:DNA-binding GntR family transcriptional regulator